MRDEHKRRPLAAKIAGAIRRTALQFRFSPSPIAGSDGLAVRRTPHAMDEDVDASVRLEVRDWSVYRHTLFAEFRVETIKGRPDPVRALVVFSSCAVETPIDRHWFTKVAVPVPASHVGTRVALAIELADGRIVVEWRPATRALAGDPAAVLFNRFGVELRSRPAGRVLEIGSRARSGNEYRHIVPDDWEYVGVDVKAGPNVDVVGDAHELAAAVGDRRFDAVFAVSVFEHLLMPWKVVLEINRVLEVGGLVFVATHQSYPLHDPPWDFWRFSDRAWLALFNEATGFEIVDTALGERATIVPFAIYEATWTVDAHPAYQLSSVLARKTGDATVTWPVDAASLLHSKYPR